MQKQYPLISVVIPSKNRKEFLQKAIESVIGQTYQNVEIIVVDDGSDIPLNSMLMEQFGEKITCLRHEHSLGSPVARNTGASVARGDFIAFLDDDDIWKNDKLEKQVIVATLEDDVALVYSGFSYVYEGKVVYSSLPTKKGEIFKELVEKNFIGSSSIPLLKTRIFYDSGGFDVAFPSCQDWEMWIRISKKNKVSFVDEILVERTIHGNQITNDCIKKIQGRKQLVHKHIEDFLCYPKQLAKQLQRIATLNLIINNRKAARYYYMKSLGLNKVSGVTVAGFLISMLPYPVYVKFLSRFALSRFGSVIFYH
jgi:glycosyltransferase involved in cell wall biosynthesis